MKKKKLLGIIGGLSLIGAGVAAATVVACSNKHQTQIDYSQLEATIKDANHVLENNINPNPDAEATLQTAIDIAQGIVDQAKSSQDEVNDAVETLKAAINTFKDATKTIYTELVAAINNADQAIVDNINPNEEAEMTLNGAINVAQNVVNDAEASQVKVDEAVNTLNAAIEAFKNATKTDYSKLEATIKVAKQTLEANKDLNSDADATLNAAINVAQNIVDQANSNQAKVNEADVTLNTAIEAFNEKILPYQKLMQKIKEVQEVKQTIIDKNEWEGPIASVKTALETVINKAIEAVKDQKLDNEKVTKILAELDNAVRDFKSALPESIISEAINREKEDIKYRVDKDWKYSDFWTDENDLPNNKNKRLIDTIYSSIAEIAKDKGYNETEITNLQDKVKTWVQNYAHLVYIDIDTNGNQVIKEIIQSDTKGTLEEIFLNNVKANHQNELNEDGSFKAGFWEDTNRGARLSLGVSFDKDAKNEELPETTKDFWTFTFAPEFNGENIREIVAKRKAEGPIIVNVQKGYSYNAFWSALAGALKKELLYDRCIIPQKLRFEFTYGWTKITRDQVANGAKNIEISGSIQCFDIGSPFYLYIDCTVNII